MTKIKISKDDSTCEFIEHRTAALERLRNITSHDDVDYRLALVLPIRNLSAFYKIDNDFTRKNYFS